MKLEPEERQRPVLDRRDRAGRGHGQRHKLRAGILYLVSVAHPDNCLVGYAMEEGLVGAEHLALGAAELTRRRALHLSPQDLGRKLHPVADAEYRDAHPEELRIAMRRAGLVHAPGTARKDQGQRVQLPHALGRDVVADDPGEGVPLADPACDELDVLCSKVEDQNRLRRGIDELHELLRSSGKETGGWC